MIKGKGKDAILYKRAGDVTVGDVMLLMGPADTQQLLEAVIVTTRTTVNSGMFAPLPTSGTIIVNGLVASVHRCERLALQLSCSQVKGCLHQSLLAARCSVVLISWVCLLIKQAGTAGSGTGMQAKCCFSEIAGHFEA
jgi:hypothetical protein